VLSMPNDADHEFAESAASIPAFLAQRCMDEGYPTRFADAICQCGGRVFSLTVDETIGEACWFCDGCDAVYLFHSVETDEEYHGSPDSDEVDCVCPCGQDRFEIVVGASLYGRTESVRMAYIGCRCVACGLMGCYASWPRVDMPYARFFANMANRLRD
jgi:hypothetical protein